jgi:class 3 adenylate cyclase/predicted ATPase
MGAAMDIAEWLRNLELAQYEALFRSNDIDGSVLSSLTNEDLKDLGVFSIGHRRKLLDAIAALRGAKADVAPVEPIGISGGAERRQLSLMFCDLVGSTPLATRVDPEDLHDIIGAYHRTVSEAIGRFDGFVAKFMGDGVLAYFGYPHAHEHDAERAVYAGLAVIDAVARLTERGEDLAVRVGIATGLVVVGDLIGKGAAQERGVVGETPNLAARLQALAAPNGLIVADATRRQVGTLFEFEDLGAQQLAGFAAPQRVWRVLGESGIVSRFEALRSGATPLVGRRAELERLFGEWQHASAGKGRVALISGEPGIGKSRLVAEFADYLRSEPHVRLRYFCSPHHSNSALYPFITQLERAAGFAREDTAEQKRVKLNVLLARAAKSANEIELIAELMSLPNDVADLNLVPQRKRQLLLEALVHQLDGLALIQPVLIVFEDAHWSDATSRDLLGLLIQQLKRSPVLMLITFRPEFDPPWRDLMHVMSLTLNRLTGAEGVTLVEQLAGNRPLSGVIVEEIVERTDGVPLFVEELTKSVLESTDRGDLAAVLTASPAPLTAIPSTLHASLTARLDRLGTAAKEVAQIGTVLGREFSYELIRLVAARPDLDEALGRLTEAGLLFRRGDLPHSSYLFKHALVQDAAYSTLLRRRRQQLHGRVAEALEAHFPELRDSQPELFAQHYADAGLVEKSVVYWGKSGRRSAARSAMAEAAAQLQKGLDQLALLPDTPERKQQELELRSSQGTVFTSIKGAGAPETGQAYARAHELWEQLGSPAGFLHIPFGQSNYHIQRGEVALAQRLAEGLLGVSHRRNDSAGMVLGHYSAGRNLMLIGKFASSRWHSEKALSLYDPKLHRSLVLELAFPPNVSSLGNLGFVLFCLGYPDQAAEHSSASIVEARRLAHRTCIAASLAFEARRLSLLGDHAALSERTDELVAVATEQGFRFWSAEGTLLRGWVKVKDGDVAEGISLLRAGTTALRATGMEAWTPHPFALLAEACEIAGEFEESLAWLDRALQVVETTGISWLAAELNRRQGQLLLRQGNNEAAEELYGKALGIAREQEAKLWELRAAVSLARLRRDQGHRVEARDLLAPVYSWFTEGFDTPDLKEAKALLAELA